MNSERVPAGWFEAPFGQFRANPLVRLDPPPQAVGWSIPVYLDAPDAEAYRRGYEDALNDAIRNEIEWVRAYFDGEKKTHEENEQPSP